MSLRKWIGRTVSLFWATLILLLITLAVYTAAGRQITQRLPDYKEKVESLLSDALKTPVEIDSLTSQWDLYQPVVQVHGIALQQADVPPADWPRLESATIKLDIVSSLLSLKPIIGLLRISGLGATVEITEDNQIKLKGIHVASKKKGKGKAKLDLKKGKGKFLLEVALKQPNIQVENTAIRFIEKGKERTLNAELISLVKVGKKHHLDAVFTLAHDSVARLNFKAIAKIDPDDPFSLSADWNASLSGQDVAPWLPSKFLAGLKVDQLIPEVHVWGRISKGRIADLIGDVAFKDVLIKGWDGEYIQKLHRFKANFFLKHSQQQHWQLALNQIVYEHGDTFWSDERFYLDFVSDDVAKKITLQVSRFDLQHFVRILLATDLLKAKQHEMLRHVMPEGQINDISLSVVLPKEPGSMPQVSFQGGFQQLGLNAFEAIPGLKGLNGYVEGSLEDGVIQIDSQGGVFDWPKGMPVPIPYDQLSAAIEWHKEDQNILFQSGLIKVHTPDASGEAMLSVLLPTEKEKIKEVELQLVSTILNGNGEKTADYLPKILHPQLTDWLGNAIKSGRLVDGNIIYNGPIILSREERKRRTIQLQFIAENGELEFLPGWPRIKKGLADVLLYDGNTHIDVYKGQIYDAKIDHATVDVPHFELGSVPILYVNGSMDGNTRDGLKVLQESPIKEFIGPIINDMAAEGEMALDLFVGVPLGKDSDYKLQVDVQVDVDKTHFELKPVALKVDQVKGHVGFNLATGLNSKSLTGKLFGRSAKAQIHSIIKDQHWTQTLITAKGTAHTKQLKEWSKQWIFDFFDGDTDYKADIHLFNGPQNERPENYIQVSSSLRGVTIDIPPPLNKSDADQIAPLHYRMNLALNKDSPFQINVDYNDLFSGYLQVDGKGVERGSLYFGDREILTKPELPGLLITGNLEKVDYDQWARFITRLIDVQTKPITGDVKPATQQRPLEDMFRLLDIYAGEATAFGLKLKNVKLQAHLDGRDWLIGVHNDVVSGMIEVPEYYMDKPPEPDSPSFDWRFYNHVPIGLNISYLKVPDDIHDILQQENPEPNREKNSDKVREGAVQNSSEYSAKNITSKEKIATETETFTLLPTEIPPMNLNLKKLYLEGEDWGSWQAQVIATPQKNRHVRLTSAKFKGLSVNGDGVWFTKPTEKGLETFSQFQGSATAEDAANVMAGFGYEPTLKSSDAKVDVDVTWPGSPVEFDVYRLTGDLKLKLKKGQILSVDPAASSVRVIGLLNFQTLSRRMQLDFSDLYQKGLPYDSIEGDFKIKGDILSTKSMKIRGPSTQMDIRGDMNIKEGTLDQQLTLVIPVSRNLVLPAAVAGGLPAAATVYVIDKAIGEQLDKLTTVRFKMQGDINDPTFSQVKLFNLE